MAMKGICFVLLVMYVPISRSKTCQIRNQRNKTQDVCCADYEQRGYDCIACLKGYLSDIGQNCKPCPKNTYGERCRYDCSCSDSEVCNNVEGCVQFSPTTGSSFVASSDTFIRRTSNKSCYRTTASDKKEKVCCADFEEKESGCIACSEGYTSDNGQYCRPCSNNLYGVKCRYTCNCSGYEICDHIEGCVKSSSTTAASVDASSHEKTLTLNTRTATDSPNDFSLCFSSEFDETTPSWYTYMTDPPENGQSTENNIEDLLSRKVITYYTLTLMVVVPGICICFIFYKYKIVPKKKKAACIQIRNHLLPKRSTNIGIEENLYDNIEDSDIQGYIHDIEPMDIAPIHHVILNSPTCKENRENASSFDDVQYKRKKDDLSLPLIKNVHPNIGNKTTLATVHIKESSSFDKKRGAALEFEYGLEHHNAPWKDTLPLTFEYDISSVRDMFTVPHRCMSKMPQRVSQSCDNLNTESVNIRISLETNKEHMKSIEGNMMHMCDIVRSKSESFI